MRALLAAVAALLAVTNHTVTSAFGQTITLTSPAAPLDVPEGDDFATTELRNPWDFGERRDIGWEENFDGTSIAASGGVWRGVNASPGGHVFPLFGGFAGGLHAEAPAGDRSLPRFGANHGIDTSRYTYLSYRLRHSARSTYAVYWRSAGGPSNWPDGSQYGATYDGFYLAQAHQHSGYQVYSFDLKNPRFDILHGAWTGTVVSLRLDPSIAAGAGATTEIDWIRLVDPHSAPTIEIKWQSTGLPPGSVVTVWADSDAVGYDGSPLAHYGVGPQFVPPPAPFSTTSTLPRDVGVHALKTALLPPGIYYFYVTVSVPSGSGLVPGATSSYSSRLRVLSAPEGHFHAPSTTSGADYAAVEAGNPWDMSDAADLANLPQSGLPQVLRQFSNESFVNGVFQATADAPYAHLGNSESDVQLLMSVPPWTPIATSKYRYLTYRLGVDETLYPDIADKVSQGWVARPIFWNDNLFSGGSLKAHVVYEGFNTYTIDLWSGAVLESGVPWTALPVVRNLRFDPLETATPTWFFVDWVKLTAMDEPTGGAYQVRFAVTDADGDSVDVSLYADNNQSGYNGQLLGKLYDLAPGQHSFAWNTSSFPAGTYYLYAEVTDGVHLRRFYADAAVLLGSGQSASPKREVLDYNGDGKSDPVVYRPWAGAFYTHKTLVGPHSVTWGGPTYRPVAGDFDGDKISDTAVISIDKGIMHWLIKQSSTQALYHTTWGVVGDRTAVADYDGDGRDEVAIYRQGLWFVLYANGSTQVTPWGQAGDIPVAADYDGDTRADFAIWRPATGEWWVLYSGFASGHTHEYYTAAQWGLPGDIPVVGDFDGDSKSDYGVWRPSEGNWYLRFTGSLDVEVRQWGLPGDVPIVGDFIGDDRLDFTVWRPSSGTWYHNDRLGGWSQLQWGLPGDLVPVPGS